MTAEPGRPGRLSARRRHGRFRLVIARGKTSPIGAGHWDICDPHPRLHRRLHPDRCGQLLK